VALTGAGGGGGERPATNVHPLSSATTSAICLTR
jgi:hypothetical protein